MLIDTDKIKELLAKDDVKGYRISKETTVTQQAYDRYKKGIAKLENMPLETAIELQKYINKENGEMRIIELEKSEVEKLKEILEDKGFNMDSWELVLDDSVDNIGGFLKNTDYRLNGGNFKIEKK